MDPNLAGMTTQALQEFVSGCEYFSELLLEDIRSTHAHHMREFFPDGLGGFPDIELASTFGDVVRDLVGGAGSVIIWAKLAREELRSGVS